MAMENIHKQIQLRILLLSGLFGLIIFAIPSLAIIYSFKLTNPIIVFFLFAWIIIELPLVAIFMWLFGKASNWENPIAQIQVNMIWPSRLSGLALGIFIGLRIIGPLGGIFGGILGYILIYRILGIYISKIIAQKIFELAS